MSRVAAVNQRNDMLNTVGPSTGSSPTKLVILKSNVKTDDRTTLNVHSTSDDHLTVNTLTVPKELLNQNMHENLLLMESMIPVNGKMMEMPQSPQTDEAHSRAGSVDCDA